MLIVFVLEQTMRNSASFYELALRGPTIIQPIRINGDAFGDIIGSYDLTSIQQDASLAKARNGSHVVANEDDGPTTVGDMIHLAETFALELGVTDR